MTAADLDENLLFAALRALLGSGGKQGKANLGNIGRVLALAFKENLDALVARGLQDLGAEANALGLESRRNRALRRALLLERDRSAVNQEFQARGIDHLFFKGVLTDSLWWGGEGLRGTADIDILVPSSAEAVATAALEKIGYKRMLFPGHLATDDASKERLFVSEDRQAHFAVDLHLALLNQPPYRDFSAQVFQRAVNHETAAGPMVGPCCEDMLVHAAGNLGQSCFAVRFKLALDAACIILRESPNLDTVLTQARWCGVTTPLWGLLRLIEERLHVPVPSHFLNQLTPAAPLRRVVERVAGVDAAPLHPRHTAGRILACWPMSGRAFWPAKAILRWAQLRMADRARQRLFAVRQPAAAL
jgi:hypothetical protein